MNPMEGAAMARSYDHLLVVLSGILASAVDLFSVSRNKLGWLGLVPQIIIDHGLIRIALVAHASACCGGLQPDVHIVKNKAGHETSGWVAIYGIYRDVTEQEALGNILRHSGSGTAGVRLVRGAAGVSLEVTDAGCGMRSAVTSGVGIAGMRERVQQLGGHLYVGSAHGGTTLRAVIPLSQSKGCAVVEEVALRPRGVGRK
jgi:signal transduction histidine kinase